MAKSENHSLSLLLTDQFLDGQIASVNQHSGCTQPSPHTNRNTNTVETQSVKEIKIQIQ